MYPFSVDPKLGRREGATLSAKCIILWEVAAQLCLVHTHSLPLADCPVKTWSCLGHPGRHLRAAASPADGQQRSGRLGNGQKATKCPYSSTACSEFPFVLALAEVGWVRQGVVASTPTAQCTSHTIVHHRSTYRRETMLASQEGPNCAFCKIL